MSSFDIRYKTKAPFGGKKFSFRSFTVAEFKKLLIAVSLEDPEQIIDVVDDLVSNFIVGDKPNNLIDHQWVFLQIMSKSIGEVCHVQYKCEECGKSFPVDINVEDTEYVKSDVSNVIPLDSQTYLILKPCIVTSEEMNDILIAAFDHLMVGDKRIELTHDEVIQFSDNNLQHKHLRVIEEYIINQDKLVLKLNTRCKFCGHPHELVFDNMYSFFQLMVSNDTFENYIKTNFSMMQHHNYTMADIESMYPWERDIYLSLLREHVKEVNQQQQKMHK